MEKQPYHYQLTVDRELTDEEKIFIRQLVKGNIDIGMRPILNLDWRQMAADHAKRELLAGRPCNYHSLGISYSQLGIKYSRQK